jgi:hypothetical protein
MNELTEAYRLHINRSLTTYTWNIRNPENGNWYKGTAINWDAARQHAWNKIWELENAPTPTMPNGERI